MYFFIGKILVFFNGVNYFSYLCIFCRLNCFVSFIKSVIKFVVLIKKWVSINNKFVVFDVVCVSMIILSVNWKCDVGLC